MSVRVRIDFGVHGIERERFCRACRKLGSAIVGVTPNLFVPAIVLTICREIATTTESAASVDVDH